MVASYSRYDLLVVNSTSIPYHILNCSADKPGRMLPPGINFIEMHSPQEVAFSCSNLIR